MNFGKLESNICYKTHMSVLIPMIYHIDINYCHRHDEDEQNKTQCKYYAKFATSSFLQSNFSVCARKLLKR